MAVSRARPDSSEPPHFSQEARVKIYYFICRLFPKAEVSSAGIYGGFHGGKAQALLDQIIREELGLLRLGGGLSIDNQLREFIVQSATDTQLLEVMELVPVVAKATPHLTLNVTDAVERLLASLGVAATFNERGKLQDSARVTVDTTMRQIGDLPLRDDLNRSLPNTLTAHDLVSVLFIDLDRFKLLNDRLGHPAGDKCLAQFVEITSAVAKLRGKLFRYGGDEFVMVMPNFSSHEASATGERIRRTVEHAQIGGEVEVTTSIGVASSSDYPEAAHLIAAADEAMYAAKMVDGPNRVREAPLSAEIRARAAQERARAKGR